MGSGPGVIPRNEGSHGVRLHPVRSAAAEIPRKLGMTLRRRLFAQPMQPTSEAEASAPGLDALVVRPENFAAVRRILPESLAVIEFINELDAASREFLREVFQDLNGRTLSLRKSASGVARPSMTRSASASPTTLANLKP